MPLFAVVDILEAGEEDTTVENGELVSVEMTCDAKQTAGLLDDIFAPAGEAELGAVMIDRFAGLAIITGEGCEDDDGVGVGIATEAARVPGRRAGQVEECDGRQVDLW